MRCREEFGPEVAVPADLLNYLLGNGWTDTSWHNNVCPSFQRGAWWLWVDCENPADREFPQAPRFSLDPFDPQEWEFVGGSAASFEDVDSLIAHLTTLP